MTINIPTDNKKYFRQCLEILKVMPPLDDLSNRELDVLGGFLYYNYKYRDIKEDEVRYKIVFDYDIKIAICDEVGISEATMNNLLTSLRRKNILKGTALTSTYGINPETPQILFKFDIEKDN